MAESRVRFGGREVAADFVRRGRDPSQKKPQRGKDGSTRVPMLLSSRSGARTVQVAFLNAEPVVLRAWSGSGEA